VPALRAYGDPHSRAGTVACVPCATGLHCPYLNSYQPARNQGDIRKIGERSQLFFKYDATIPDADTFLKQATPTRFSFGAMAFYRASRKYYSRYTRTTSTIALIDHRRFFDFCYCANHPNLHSLQSHPGKSLHTLLVTQDHVLAVSIEYLLHSSIDTKQKHTLQYI
jgi:hypothetical protein